MVTSQEMTLSLLRTPFCPNIHADYGIHRMAYAFYPHPHRWDKAKVWKAGYGYNIPLLAFRAHRHGSKGKIPKLQISGDVVVTAIKKSEEGGKILIRCYEPSGKRAKVKIHCEPVRAWYETDIVECSRKKISNGNRMVADVAPFEIKSFMGTSI